MAKKQPKKQKPVIVIGVEGGVADYQVVPHDAPVEVIHIDWDDLKEGEAPVDQIEELIAKVKAAKDSLPDDPQGYLKGILEQLEEAKENAEEALAVEQFKAESQQT
jgi:hypothetical protein